MGLFNFHKKSKPQDPESTSAEESSDVKSLKNLHTAKKNKSLITKMKVSESVPATIIDAINGDKSVVNSDKDFVRATGLHFSDGVYYPVFVMDEDTLVASGLGERQNKNQFGQVSVGLKTSSGASGFLPVVTTESLNDNYIALLPMHDAFEVLNDFPTFAKYEPGWLVGLLNIDDDELSLKLTSLRLPMAQWWTYVNGKLNFKVENDELMLDENVPTSTDALALNHDEADVGKATRVFDDDQPTSGAASSITSFGSSADSVPDSDTAATPDPVENGIRVSDMPPIDDDDQATSDASSDDDQGKAVSSETAPASLDATSAVSDDDSVASDDVPPVESAAASDADSGSTVASSSETKNPFVSPVSRDDLEADSAIMTSSVRTLTDLKVSVSDREFLDAYLTPLTVTKLPMLDDANDPTGKIHHENELRQKANVELESMLKERKARLRQWFETQRSSMLDALHNKVQEDGSQIKSNRKTLKELQKDLNDDEGLRRLAEDDVRDDLDGMDSQFADELSNARQQALVEVEAQFNQKKVALNQRKKDVVEKGVAKKRQAIAKQITEIKHDIQAYAQTAASKVYTEVMEQGAMEFRKAQDVLETNYRRHVADLVAYEKSTRSDEDKRVADEADIARHDTTITALNERINELKDRHQAALSANTAKFEEQLDAVQTQATNAQQLAVSQVQDELNKVTEERDALKAKTDDQLARYEDSLEKRDAAHEKQVATLHADMQKTEDNFDRDVKRRRFGYLSVAVLLMLFGLTGGFASGTVLMRNTSNNNGNTKTVAVPMYQAPAQASSSSAPAASSSSSVSSSSSSSNDDKHQDSKQSSSSSQSQNSSNSSSTSNSSANTTSSKK